MKPPMRSSPDIEDFKPLFFIGRNAGSTMSRPHRHNDLEMSVVLEGNLEHRHGSEHLHFFPGSLIVFWAVRPHWTEAVSSPFLKYTLHLPLTWFLQLQLPADFVSRILDGEVVVDGDTARCAEDKAMAQRWYERTLSPSHASERLVLMEVEVRLGWLALAQQTAPAMPPPHSSPQQLDKTDRMVRFIIEHYTEPISSAEVAQAANLHPKYAMALFRDKLDVTILQFITAQRIAHAAHLLITTDLKTASVAFQSGFGTLSHFYKAFGAAHHLSPNAYRDTFSTNIQ